MSDPGRALVLWCSCASSHRNHHLIPIQGHLSQFSNAHCTGLQMTEKFSKTKSLQRLVYLASQLIQVHLDFSFFLQRTSFREIYAINMPHLGKLWTLSDFYKRYKMFTNFINLILRINVCLDCFIVSSRRNKLRKKLLPTLWRLLITKYFILQKFMGAKMCANEKEMFYESCWSNVILKEKQ